MHVFHGEGFWVDPEWRDVLAEIGLTPDRDWTRLSSNEAITASYHTTHSFRFRLKDGQTVYFKRYVYQKPLLKHWLQPTKAATEAAGFHDLKKLGINTIQALAYGERRWMGLVRAAFIVTLGIPNTVELGQYLAREWLNMDYSKKQAALHKIQPQLIEQLQTAHNAGFFHWDLKLRNILLQRGSNRITWIDCPRSRFKASNDRDGILNDFSAMARVGVRVLTPGQRMRFLLEYTNGDTPLARALYKNVANRLEKSPPRPYWHLLAKDDPVYLAEHKKWREQS